MRKKLSEPTFDALFDSPVKVRLLKLFLRNPEENFDLKTAAAKLDSTSARAKKNVEQLAEIGFLIRKNSKDGQTFFVNRGFAFYNELRDLLMKTSPASKEKMLAKLKGAGKIKLAVLSGIFVNCDTSGADLLVVGDGVKAAKFKNFIKNLEAEIGKEINYSLMTTKEFYYRHGMYDRFIRDLLDFKHEKLIDKLKI